MVAVAIEEPFLLLQLFYFHKNTASSFRLLLVLSVVIELLLINLHD